MYYVYILRSTKKEGAVYIGYTADLKKRIVEHNDPRHQSYSQRYSPWALETYLSFSEMREAKSFEKYLKSNSGKAFMHKRLLSRGFSEALKKFRNNRRER